MIPDDVRHVIGVMYAAKSPRPCMWLCKSCRSIGLSHDPVSAFQWHYATKHRGA